MAQKSSSNVPVTGVCIVADPQKCPPGYDILIRNGKDECDLWSDSLLRRTTRYLCFTRQSQLIGRTNVLTGMTVLSDKELMSSEYLILDRTIDTSEKALKKKQIGIMMTSRNSATDAIVDIIFQSRSRRTPDGWTTAGEINGLTLCVKMGKVPLDTQTFSHSSNSNNVPLTSCQTAALPPIPSEPISSPNKAAMSVPTPAPKPALRSKNSFNPMADIQFHMNLRHQNLNGLRNRPVQEVLFRSSVDIENEFSYPFSLERSLVHHL